MARVEKLDKQLESNVREQITLQKQLSAEKQKAVEKEIADIEKIRKAAEKQRKTRRNVLRMHEIRLRTLMTNRGVTQQFALNTATRFGASALNKDQAALLKQINTDVTDKIHRKERTMFRRGLE